MRDAVRDQPLFSSWRAGFGAGSLGRCSPPVAKEGSDQRRFMRRGTAKGDNIDSEKLFVIRERRY